VLEDLEAEEVEFGLAGEFLLELEKKFGEGDEHRFFPPTTILCG